MALNGEEIHKHHRVPERGESYQNLVFLHLYCHQAAHARDLLVSKCLA